MVVAFNHLSVVKEWMFAANSFCEFVICLLKKSEFRGWEISCWPAKSINRLRNFSLQLFLASWLEDWCDIMLVSVYLCSLSLTIERCLILNHLAGKHLTLFYFLRCNDPCWILIYIFLNLHQWQILQALLKLFYGCINNFYTVWVLCANNSIDWLNTRNL